MIVSRLQFVEYADGRHHRCCRIVCVLTTAPRPSRQHAWMLILYYKSNVVGRCHGRRPWTAARKFGALPRCSCCSGDRTTVVKIGWGFFVKGVDGREDHFCAAVVSKTFQATSTTVIIVNAAGLVHKTQYAIFFTSWGKYQREYWCRDVACLVEYTLAILRQKLNSCMYDFCGVAFFPRPNTWWLRIPEDIACVLNWWIKQTVQISPDSMGRRRTWWLSRWLWSLSRGSG